MPAAERQLARYRESAGRMAHEAIRALLDSQKDASRIQVASILDSSGRRGKDLATTLSSHALIHAADGDHFRDALADACARCGLGVTRIPRQELMERAATVLRRPPEQLQASIQILGRSLGPPWGADQKTAALLGWMVLADARGHDPNERGGPS